MQTKDIVIISNSFNFDNKLLNRKQSLLCLDSTIIENIKYNIYTSFDIRLVEEYDLLIINVSCVKMVTEILDFIKLSTNDHSNVLIINNNSIGNMLNNDDLNLCSLGEVKDYLKLVTKHTKLTKNNTKIPLKTKNYEMNVIEDEQAFLKSLKIIKSEPVNEKNQVLEDFFQSLLKKNKA